MITTQTAEDVRNQLGAFLTKPLQITSGTLSTQQTLSPTSLSSGGLTGLIKLGNKATLLVDDGTTNRILLGYQAGGF